MSKTTERLIEQNDRETTDHVNPITLGRPAQPKRLGKTEIPYNAPRIAPTKVNANLGAALLPGDPQRAIVLHGYGSVSKDGEILSTGPVEIALDDLGAANLAAELINQLSGPFLTCLYAPLETQRATVFKAFRAQFLEDVRDYTDAFDKATDYHSAG